MKKTFITILICLLVFTLAACGGNFADSARAQYNLARNYAKADQVIDFNALGEIEISQAVTMTNGLIKAANNGDIVQTAVFQAKFGENARTYFESRPLITIDSDGSANYLTHNERFMYLNNFYYPRSNEKYSSYADMLDKNPLSIDNLYRSAIFLPLDNIFSSFEGAKSGKFYVLKAEVTKASFSTFFSYFELFHPFLKLKYQNEDIYSYFNPNSVKKATLSLKLTENSLVEAEFDFLINGVGQMADISVKALTKIKTANVSVPDKWA